MDNQQANYLVQQGYINLQNNNREQAIKYFNDVLRIDENNFDANLSLGSVYMQSRDYETAYAYLHQATIMSPSNVMAQGRLGVCLYSMQRLEEAIACYEKVVALDPVNISAYANLAIAYQDAGLRQQAVDYSKKTIELNPAFTSGYCLLASSLSLLGEYEASLRNYETALTLGPDNLYAISGKVGALIKLGKKKEAALIVQEKIDNGVLDQSIIIQYATTSRVTNDEDKAAGCIEKALTDSALTHKQRLHLHFTAGELYDHMGEYDRAFNHYAIGNKLVQRKYVKELDDAYFNNILGVFTKKNMEIMPRSTERGVKPVFIVGMPRSGTSLVERILGSHSAVFPAGELTAIYELTNKICNMGDIDDVFPGCVPGLDIETINRCSKEQLSYLSEISDKSPIVIDKVPHNFLFLGLIEMLFPDARIIHCTREPLDTCLSNYFQYFSGPLAYSYELENIANHYNNYLKIMEHWNGVISLPLMEIGYEALTSNQEVETHKLIDFLELPWEDSCLKYYENDHVTRTASYDQVRNPIYSKSVGRWKHYEKYLQPLIDNLMLN